MSQSGFRCGRWETVEVYSLKRRFIKGVYSSIKTILLPPLDKLYKPKLLFLPTENEISYVTHVEPAKKDGFRHIRYTVYRVIYA